jgi:hypothetical protein
VIDKKARFAGRRGSAAAKVASGQIADALTSIISDLIERFRGRFFRQRDVPTAGLTIPLNHRRRDARGVSEAGTSCRYGLYSLMPTDNDIIQDERGQDQPKNKEAAQKRGVKEQKEAAKQQQESPGEPAGGE